MPAATTLICSPSRASLWYPVDEIEPFGRSSLKLATSFHVLPLSVVLITFPYRVSKSTDEEDLHSTCFPESFAIPYSFLIADFAGSEVLFHSLPPFEVLSNRSS